MTPRPHLLAAALAAATLSAAGTASGQVPEVYAQTPAPGATPAEVPQVPSVPSVPAPMPGVPPNQMPVVPAAGYPPMPAMPAMPAVVEEAPRPPRRPRVDSWQAMIGLRAALIRSTGFDPFSNQDGVAAVALSFSRVLLRQDRLALALGLDFNYGGSSTNARGAPSSLGLTRGSLLIEGRYAFAPRLYGFLRATPGVLYLSASIQDPTAPSQQIGGTTPLTDSATVPAVDGSVGAAVGLAPRTSPVGAWILAQGGYGWAASHDLVLAPQLGGPDQSKIAPVALGSLSASGPFLVVSFALSF